MPLATLLEVPLTSNKELGALGHPIFSSQTKLPKIIEISLKFNTFSTENLKVQPTRRQKQRKKKNFIPNKNNI